MLGANFFPFSFRIVNFSVPVPFIFVTLLLIYRIGLAFFPPSFIEQYS